MQQAALGERLSHLEPNDLRRGDLIFWKGHVAIVHQVRDGMLYTIEGNRSPRVQGFSYVLTRMEKLLGFGHLV